MTNHENIQERCPSCNGNDVEADRRFGYKLKVRELNRQAFRNPLVWIGFALLVFPLWIPGLGAWHYALEALGFGLIMIPWLRIRRAVFAPGAVTQFPEVKYTCRLCGHQWTSDESRTAMAHEANETEVTDRNESQDVQENLHATTETKLQTGKMSAVISFFLAIFLSVPVMLIIDQVSNGTLDEEFLITCCPAPAVIIALGAGAGGLLAKSLGGNPWRAATIGIWIGAIVSIGVLVLGVTATGP